MIYIERARCLHAPRDIIAGRCAIVSTASVPAVLPLRVDATLGALMLKEMNAPAKTVFSRQKQPVAFPSSFWKLIAVHACTTLEGMVGALNPAIAIAIRYGVVPARPSPFYGLTACQN